MRILDILIDGISSGAQYALFAAGLSLIFGIMRLVNLAHGDFIILAAYVLFAVSWGLGALGLPPELNLILALVISAPILFALGYAVQRGVLNRTLGRDILPPLLVTFALSVIIQNGLFLIFSPDTRSIDSGALSTAGINIGYRQISVLAVITVGVAIAVIGGLQFLFFRTALGRDFRAVSDDPEVAELMGINRRHVFALAMGVAIVVVAIAGMMFGVAGSFDPYLGPTRLLSAFEAVIIGGVGSLWGTLVGGAILGISEQFGSRAFGEEFKQISGHVAFLVILLLRPRGLFPRDKD
ncbi:MAG: branched-chain amino acid ABC transporter permease [Alphaproteobacteria bacterium]